MFPRISYNYFEDFRIAIFTILSWSKKYMDHNAFLLAFVQFNKQCLRGLSFFIMLNIDQFSSTMTRCVSKCTISFMCLGVQTMPHLRLRYLASKLKFLEINSSLFCKIIRLSIRDGGGFMMFPNYSFRIILKFLIDLSK